MFYVNVINKCYSTTGQQDKLIKVVISIDIYVVHCFIHLLSFLWFSHGSRSLQFITRNEVVNIKMFVGTSLNIYGGNNGVNTFLRYS